MPSTTWLATSDGGYPPASRSESACPNAWAIGPVLPASARLSGSVARRAHDVRVDQPGQTTETPIGAPVTRQLLVHRLRERHDAVLGDVVHRHVWAVVSPAIDAVLTMWPSSPPASMRGRKARTPWITPQRLTPITHCQSASVCSCTGADHRDAGVVADHVGRAEGFVGLVGQPLDVLRARDVDTRGQDRAPCRRSAAAPSPAPRPRRRPSPPSCPRRRSARPAPGRSRSPRR